MLMNPPSGGDSFQATDGSLLTGANGSAVVTVPSSATRQALQRGWSVYSPQYSSAPPDALTLAQLQINTPASSVLPGSAQAFYYTSDQGLVYSNGVAWVNQVTLQAKTGKRMNIGALGDSLVAKGSPNQDLYSATVAQVWATEFRNYNVVSWLAHGAMRSAGSWFPNEIMGAYSGATSAPMFMRFPVLACSVT